ncbi:MAG: OmpA family protein [Lentisphaerae bacterium]|nr:OmpA family protein [Lentisphaerota bacterium]
MNKVWKYGLMCALLLTISITGCSKLRKPRATYGSDDNGFGYDPMSSEFGSSSFTSRSVSELGTIVNIELPSVQFNYDSARVSESERPKAEKVAAYMRANPSFVVVIEGHCDERGSREYNLALGERRALAVRAYLIGLRIDGARLQTKSFGEEMPLDPAHNEAAWRLNRRAEFVVYKP